MEMELFCINIYSLYYTVLFNLYLKIDETKVDFSFYDFKCN